MRARTLTTVCFLLAALAVPAAAAAQTTTGTLDGTILDPDGRPLPGVTVVANSPALIQRDLTAVSNAAGYYRFQLLPPGSYSVTYTLQGFRALERADLVVRVGQNTAVDAALELASVQETEIVIGETPNIDPRQAQLGFSYTAELAENIPTARNMNDLLSTIPGVESVNNLGGGMQPGTWEVQNVLGAGERSSSYRLDGLNTTDPAGQWNTQGMMSYDIIQEIQVLKAAKPAEVPFQGALFNVISKSGGNSLTGNIGAYFANDSLQGSNGADGAGGETTNELVEEYELTGSLGGALIRDKLWWFGSGRVFKGTTTLFGFPADITQEINALSAKITYQPDQNHRITATASAWDQEVSHYFFGYSPALALDEQASSVRPLDGQAIGARWSGILSDTVVAEASVSYSEDDFDQNLQPGGDTAIVDLVTGLRSRSPGVSAAALRDQDDDWWNFSGSVSWFVPDAGGQHDIKVGGEFMPTVERLAFDEPNDHQLHTLFGRKFAVRFLNTPTVAIWDNDLTALYAQDSWSVSDRLTLNFGLRYMHSYARSPEQTAGGGAFANTALADRFPEMRATTLAPLDLITWDTLEPRFAGTYQLGDSGRTVLRFGASRYYQNLDSFKLFVLSPAFPFTWVTLWFDRNDDFAYQVGEEGPLLFSFGGQLNSIDPNIKRPYTDELVFGVSHEPARDMQVSANFIYRRDKDLAATTDVGVPFDTYTSVNVTDPGPDGVAGTGDDGTLTVFAQDPATIGQNRLQLTNPAESERTYRGMELTASRRFTDNWQAVASLVVSEMKVLQSTVALGVLGVFDSPNGRINAEGLDENNQTVLFKLQGTYRTDFGLGISGLYRFRTGNPYTRELVVTGLPQGPFNVRAESRGESKTDNVSVLDLRLEQTFDRGPGRFGVMVDVFNLFNSAAVTDKGKITGSNYGETLSVLAPRVARLGVRYTW